MPTKMDLQREADTRRIASALERIASALEQLTVKPEPAKPEPMDRETHELEYTRDYIRTSTVWRVEYNEAWGQTRRINYCEAVDERDARGVALPPSIRVLAIRRAVPSDAEEMIRS
jgi:hypothetical protein